MGKKYIIELEDKPFHNGNGDFLYRVKGFNSLVFDMTGVGKLTPYTAPDLEQVRKEAYEDGYKTAKVQCNIQAEKDLREVGERHYQKGLSDAWEAARKIWEYNATTLNKIFSKCCYSVVRDILRKYSASEVIDRIRQYEQEKEEQIQVGDEVVAASGKAVVLRVLDVNAYYVYKDATWGVMRCEELVKTGRHFPEIAEVFEKMQDVQGE